MKNKDEELQTFIAKDNAAHKVEEMEKTFILKETLIGDTTYFTRGSVEAETEREALGLMLIRNRIAFSTDKFCKDSTDTPMYFEQGGIRYSVEELS